MLQKQDPSHKYKAYMHEVLMHTGHTVDGSFFFIYRWMINTLNVWKGLLSITTHCSLASDCQQQNYPMEIWKSIVSTNMVKKMILYW